jgi:hypothetical protein
LKPGLTIVSAAHHQVAVLAEKILVTDDAGTAPMYFDGRARLQKPFITKVKS